MVRRGIVAGLRDNGIIRRGRVHDPRASKAKKSSHIETVYLNSRDLAAVSSCLSCSGDRSDHAHCATSNSVSLATEGTVGGFVGKMLYGKICAMRERGSCPSRLRIMRLDVSTPVRVTSTEPSRLPCHGGRCDHPQTGRWGVGNDRIWRTRGARATRDVLHSAWGGVLKVEICCLRKSTSLCLQSSKTSDFYGHLHF